MTDVRSAADGGSADSGPGHDVPVTGPRGEECRNPASPKMGGAARSVDRPPLRIGALAPLTRPGWVDAGRHLVAGLQTAVADVNLAGGIEGRQIELLVRDTGADPEKATAAVDEFVGLGVAALTGEFHSVVARAAAARAAARRVPFLCSSAVIDALTDEETEWVARLCPTQSRGWRIYADFLLTAGHRRVAVISQASAYWAAGTRILREQMEPAGGTIIELDRPDAEPTDVCNALVASEASALLLLVGHPEPAVSIVRAVHRDPRLGEMLIGAPAGQPELPEWAAQLGAAGAAVPFLRYLPASCSELGVRVARTLQVQIGEAPCFVAFEAYDSVLYLAEVMRRYGVQPAEIAAAWSRVTVDGTRGRIRMSRPRGSAVWQWAWPPIEVSDRDPADPARFRTLHFG